MDVPNNSADLLELSIAAALRSRRIPIVGELWVVWSVSALASAPSATSPPPAAITLATCGTVSGVVPEESAAVAGAWADPPP